MCEYDAGCTMRDDPLAVALANKPEESKALCLVICPKQHHLLAAVYEFPNRGRVICTPHWKARFGSLFVATEGVDPGRQVHFHAAIDQLEDVEGTQYGRCRCGTWNYSADDVRDVIHASMEGRIAPPGELVKVRHENGQVTKMGKSWAVSEGLEIVGTARSHPRFKGAFVLGSYVQMADTPVVSGPEPTGVER